MTSATGQTTMKLDQVMAEWQNASLEIEELLRQSKQIMADAAQNSPVHEKGSVFLGWLLGCGGCWGGCCLIKIDRDLGQGWREGY